MAKKINTGEPPHAEACDTVPAGKAGTAETAPVETGQPETTEQAQPEKPAEKNHEGIPATEPHTLDLLKKFPAYASLYIDSHGGVFAPDTAAAIRGEAVLYKNPYYNELKTKA